MELLLQVAVEVSLQEVWPIVQGAVLLPGGGGGEKTGRSRRESLRAVRKGNRELGVFVYLSFIPAFALLSSNFLSLPSVCVCALACLLEAPKHVV